MSKSFEIPNNPESKESNENPYNLNRYWKRYNFPGNPPRPGTVAEQRVSLALHQQARQLFPAAPA